MEDTLQYSQTVQSPIFVSSESLIDHITYASMAMCSVLFIILLPVYTILITIQAIKVSLNSF